MNEIHWKGKRIRKLRYKKSKGERKMQRSKRGTRDGQKQYEIREGGKSRVERNVKREKKCCHISFPSFSKKKKEKKTEQNESTN